MDERLARFKNCDERFHRYLDKVLARLPEDIRESILSNEGFQILADSELPNVCGRCLSFDHPVEYLVYLNPKSLMQPDNRLSCSIAWELAEYVLQREGKATDDAAVVELLNKWGFEQDLDAVRYCDAVSKSPAFKSGYEWARKQSKDYLLLHFDLFFDEWNEKGLRMMPQERIETLRDKTVHSKVLPGGEARGSQQQAVEGISHEEAAIEGIMAALKEAKLQD